MLAGIATFGIAGAAEAHELPTNADPYAQTYVQPTRFDRSRDDYWRMRQWRRWQRMRRLERMREHYGRGW